MNFNFPLILVVLTFLCGLIWGAYALVGKIKGRDKNAQMPISVEYAASFFPVLFIVLVLRSFIFEPFRIPTGSMIPTLLVGDFILVNKYTYGVRLPVIHTKILSVGSPKTGDVAVFRYPAEEGEEQKDYIKRVIGLPGDTVEYREKSFIVNGEEIPLGDGKFYHEVDAEAPHPGFLHLTETIGGVEHAALIDPTMPLAMGSGTWKVPANHYFMVGDNRDRSSDSRRWGFVPEENLVGRAFMIWMHWNGGPSWSEYHSRSGSGIHIAHKLTPTSVARVTYQISRY